MYDLHTRPKQSEDQDKAKKYVLVEIEILNEILKINIA